MAIRIELYAKDQVTATQIVEYAISSGAVLQSYAEVDPPGAAQVAAPVTNGNGRSDIPGMGIVAFRFISADDHFRKKTDRSKALSQLAKWSTVGSTFSRRELNTFLRGKVPNEHSIPGIVRGMELNGNIARI